ncbi:MAG: hypothetical protein NZT61_05890 [Deltaproteobacteria bacterium]|nr:hypothetical protein [Deltaproteobacteria bacterium]
MSLHTVVDPEFQCRKTIIESSLKAAFPDPRWKYLKVNVVMHQNCPFDLYYDVNRECVYCYTDQFPLDHESLLLWSRIILRDAQTLHQVLKPSCAGARLSQCLLKQTVKPLSPEVQVSKGEFFRSSQQTLDTFYCLGNYTIKLRVGDGDISLNLLLARQLIAEEGLSHGFFNYPFIVLLFTLPDAIKGDDTSIIKALEEELYHVLDSFFIANHLPESESLNDREFIEKSKEGLLSLVHDRGVLHQILQLVSPEVGFTILVEYIHKARQLQQGTYELEKFRFDLHEYLLTVRPASFMVIRSFLIHHIFELISSCPLEKRDSLLNVVNFFLSNQDNNSVDEIIASDVAIFLGNFISLYRNSYDMVRKNGLEELSESARQHLLSDEDINIRTALRDNSETIQKILDTIRDHYQFSP